MVQSGIRNGTDERILKGSEGKAKQCKEDIPTRLSYHWWRWRKGSMGWVKSTGERRMRKRRGSGNAKKPVAVKERLATERHRRSVYEVLAAGDLLRAWSLMRTVR